MKDYVLNREDPFTDPLLATYYRETRRWIQTFAVKSDDSASRLNQWLIETHGIDTVERVYRNSFKLSKGVWETEPRVWKYYLNLAGYYHPLDQTMRVISLDTREPIPFSRTVLENHPRTVEAYQFGSDFYQRLTVRFPDQVDLILGILYPVEIETAIAAPNHTLLRFDPRGQEPQEESLMFDIQTFLFQHRDRWFLPAYAIPERYYLISYFALLALHLTLFITQARERRQKTRESHSFFIRQALRRAMGTHEFYDLLTPKQRFWIVRNLPRWVANIGSTEQFDELVQGLFTERGVSLYRFDLEQTTQFTDTHVPIRTPRAIAVNEVIPLTSLIPPSLEQLVELQKLQAPGNESYGASYPFIPEAHSSRFRVWRTKNLLAQAPSNAAVTSLTLAEIVISHWPYLSHRNAFTANASFTNPITRDLLTLTARQAFLYFHYLMATFLYRDVFQDPNATLVSFPVFICRNVRESRPLLSQYEEGLRTSSTAAPYLSAMHALFVPLTAVNSSSQFAQWVRQIHSDTQRQIKLSELPENALDRAQLRTRVNTGLLTVPVTLETRTVSQFLESLALPKAEEYGSELLSVIRSVYETTTGTSLTPTSESEATTQALIQIFNRLTSYTVQVLGVQTPPALELLDTSLVRFDSLPVTVPSIPFITPFSLGTTVSNTAL